MWPTILVAAFVVLVVFLIIFFEIKKRKEGRGGCSCGGNCGTCGFDCHGAEKNKK